MYKKYIDEKVLEKTMQLFWQKGYFNTSMEDIIQNTPLNRTAIYNHFNNKQGLFNACLELYLQKVTAVAIKPLNKTKKSIGNLKNFYKQFLKHNHIFRHKGCLMMITISDAPLHDDLINQKITNFTYKLENLIYSNLVNVKSDKQKKQLSAMLVAHTFGLLSLMRCKHTQNIISYQVQGILQVLNNLEDKSSE